MNTHVASDVFKILCNSFSQAVQWFVVHIYATKKQLHCIIPKYFSCSDKIKNPDFDSQLHWTLAIYPLANTILLEASILANNYYHIASIK